MKAGVKMGELDNEFSAGEEDEEEEKEVEEEEEEATDEGGYGKRSSEGICLWTQATTKSVFPTGASPPPTSRWLKCRSTKVGSLLLLSSSSLPFSFSMFSLSVSFSLNFS